MRTEIVDITSKAAQGAYTQYSVLTLRQTAQRKARAAQNIANLESPSTKTLYNHRQDETCLDEMERITV